VTVLVTGAGGFIGSHLVEALLAEGCAVRALVHYNSRNDWGNLEALRPESPPGLDVRQGDITDARSVDDLVEGCDRVFHLAALIGIPYSYQAPASYVATNVLGTLNVLEAGRRHGVERIVVTSTSEVYGTARYVPIDEQHPLQAQSPYAASKIAADKLAESYHRSFGLPVVVLRPFNTFGPRQSLRAIVPTILSQVLTGRASVRIGNLEPRRDLTYVTDTARAFVLAGGAPGIDGETIHFGQGRALSIGELVDRCLAVTGSEATVEVDEQRMRPAGSEVELLVCDPARAESLLGWRPVVGLDEGLRRTAAELERRAESLHPAEYVV
jgi:NAD dependent epimerase/dehydratase